MNNTKWFSIGVGAVLVLVVGVMVYMNVMDEREEMAEMLNSSEQSSGEMVVDGASGSLSDAAMEDGGDGMSDTDSESMTDGDEDTLLVSSSDSSESSEPAATGISMSDVATHNSASSCWSAINGSVYDLTSWIPNHPGGPQGILQLCGKDGSAKFNGQHGGSPKQEAVLMGFKLNSLAQ